MLRRAWGALIISLALGVPSRPAQASPLFELVGAGTGTGGFNGRGTGASAASAYFNPALLPKAKQGLEIGWLVLHDAVDIRLDGRTPDVDVPLSALDRVRTNRPPVPTSWLDQGCAPAQGGACVRDVPAAPRQGAGSSDQVRGYQMIGLVDHLLGQSLSVGLYALVPVTSFTQAHSFFVDEREQFFSNSLHPELYADRLTPVSLAFGAGSRLFRGLHAGLSFTLGLSNKASAGAYVGNSAMLADTLELSTKVEVHTNVSPHFGLTYEPSDKLSLSFTLHSPQRVEIDTKFGIYLPNGDLQYARRKATHSYLPWVAALAASYDLSRRRDTRWELAATVAFERWSRYIDRQSERPQGDYAWKDIGTGVLGVHFTRARWAAYGDVSVRPSPVPAQTGRSNYVDNARTSALVGGSYDLPIPRFGAVFRMGAQAQAHVLPARSHHKLDPRSAGTDKQHQLVRDEWPDDTIDVSTGRVIADARGLQTNNPGWPGFRSRGYIVAGMLTLSLVY